LADDITANPGVGGAIFATDEIAGRHCPREKIAWGVDGVAVDTADANGARFPVKIGEGLGATAVVAGQATVTGAESALSSAVARRVRIRALIGNTDTVYLGPTGVTAATGYPLEPGDLTPPLELSNLNVVHAFTPTGSQKIAFLGEV